LIEKKEIRMDIRKKKKGNKFYLWLKITMTDALIMTMFQALHELFEI
jgi:hypothetical protein